MFGSYALCLEHFNEFKTKPVYDRDTDEPIPGSLLGEWPSQVCTCGACVQWLSLPLSS